MIQPVSYNTFVSADAADSISNIYTSANTVYITPTQELFEDIDQLDIEFLEMYLKKFPKSVKRALKYSIDCNCVTVDFIRACLEIEPSLYKIVIDNANKIHLDEDDKEDLKRIIQAASIVCL